MAKTPKEKLKTPTDLPSNAVASVADSLNGILADSYALYLKTKNFHWHVSGPHFRDYHLLLDEQATQILATTDLRQSRALAQTTVGTCAGAPVEERTAEIRTFGSTTARTQRRRRRAACCASTAAESASFGDRSLRSQSRSRRSNPSSRRSASSMTSLSPLPVRAPCTFTARSTASSIVSVVRTFAIDTS